MNDGIFQNSVRIEVKDGSKVIMTLHPACAEGVLHSDRTRALLVNAVNALLGDLRTGPLTVEITTCKRFML